MVDQCEHGRNADVRYWVDWSNFMVLSLAADKVNLDVPRPIDCVADDEFLHKLDITFTDPELADDRFIIRVPSTEVPNDERVEVHIPALRTELISQNGILNFVNFL